MNERIQAQVNKPTQKSSFAPSTPRLLQRKCACGGTAGISGKCEECSKKKRFGLQTKLKVNKPGDSYEREADRFADQFLATPTHHALSDAPPRTQRFGHDFSRVRVHSGIAAEQSPFERNHQRRESSSFEDAPGVHQIARDGVRGAGKPVPFRNEVQPLMPGLDLSTVRAHEGLATDAALDALGANAYTTGSDLGLPANASRRLVAHELAHVAQQRQGVRLNNGIGEEGDTYEVAAGAIADRVASGQSAVDLMPTLAAPRAIAAPQAIGPVQLDIRAPRTQAELNEEAVSLAERQAKRREFLASLPDDEYWAEYVLNFEKFRNMLVEFDTYWDKSTKTFRLHSYVDTMEREVVANAEAHEIYRRTLWDRTENKPVKKSWFDNFIGFICEYTNPCKGLMEQKRKDRASGMSEEEARERGLTSLGFEAAMFLIPGGPEGPRDIGPSRGLPFKAPTPKTGEVGALEKAPVAPRAEPTSASEPLPAAKQPAAEPNAPAKAEPTEPPKTEPPKVEEPQPRIESKDPKAATEKTEPPKTEPPTGTNPKKKASTTPKTKPVLDDPQRGVKDAIKVAEQKLEHGRADIGAYNKQISEARPKVESLNKQAKNTPQNDPSHEKISEDFRRAKQELDELIARRDHEVDLTFGNKAKGHEGYQQTVSRLKKALDAKTYGRPSFWSGVREKVWQIALKEGNGKVLSPSRTEIRPGDPWVMGHKPGFEFWKHQRNAAERGISREQFVREYNAPEQYRPETNTDNSSRAFEDTTNAYFAKWL